MKQNLFLGVSLIIIKHSMADPFSWHSSTFSLTKSIKSCAIFFSSFWQVMYSFLDRLINLGLPRTRDFQGVNPNSFDGQGNYGIGIREQSVFPEIRFDALGKQKGMDVCITTTAKTDQEAQRLLALLGMPFREGSGSTTLVRKKKLKAHHFDSKSKGRSRRWSVFFSSSFSS